VSDVKINKTDRSSSCKDGQRSASSQDCHSDSKYKETLNRAGGKKHGSINLLEFASPANFVPVCEFDSLDFMISAPIADRFNALIDTSVKYCDSLLSDKALLRRLKVGDMQYVYR